MAESAESIMLRMGLDASAVNAGTVAMMDVQKKAALDYVAFWNKAAASSAAERLAIEQKANDESLAKLAALNANKLALQKAFFEKQAAMQVIAGGSGGYGSGFATAEQKAAGVAAGNIEGAVVGGAVGSIGVRALGHIWKLVKDVLTLNVEGIGHSLLMLGKKLWGFAGLIPIIGAGIAGIEGNLSMRKSLNEQAGGYGTIKTTEETTAMLAKRLGEEIKKLQDRNLLDPNQSYDLSNLDNIKRTQAALKGLLPQGFATDLGETTDEKIKKADALADLEQKLLDKKTEEQSLEESIATNKFYVDFLTKSIAEYEAKGKLSVAETVELHEEKARKLGYQLELQRLLTIEAENQKKIEDKRKEMSDTLASEQSKENRIDQETPTLEDLAGSAFTKNLNAQYGNGGRFNLASGNGPFAGIAQDAELMKKRQMWDIIHGNAEFADEDDPNGLYKAGDLIGGDAFIDKQNEIADENKLRQAGIETPYMVMMDMRDKMNYQLGKIATDISSLANKAAGNGIPVAISDDSP